MKVANESAKNTRHPMNLANLYPKMTKPPCREMNALASEKNPSTIVASSEKALEFSSGLVRGRKCDQIFLIGLDRIIKCNKRKKAEAAATYAGIMRVLYHTLKMEVLELCTTYSV